VKVNLEKKTKFIAIVGGIAVGKTTIGHGLLDMTSDVLFIEEDVSKNEFLEDFYGDMKKWAFHSRVSTLAMISSNYKLEEETFKVVLMDRCLDELITFARLQYEKGNLSEREFKVYGQLYDCIVAFAPKIDGYIYCYCDANISIDRVKKRNRSFEQGIDISYINKLNMEYEKWVREFDNQKVLKVNTGENVDFPKVWKFIQGI